MKKYNFIFGAFQSWLISWTKLACGVVGIISFGFVVPDWDTTLISLFFSKYLKNCNKEKK